MTFPTDPYLRALAMHAETLKADFITRVRYDGGWFCEVADPREGWVRV